MQISIIEDEAVWRDKIRAVVETYCRDHKISCSIHSYGSGTDFLKNPQADLLFLDIELAEGEDGFAIAGKLKDSGSPCKICFLTSHTELARQGYRVNAFRYIDKMHLEEMNEALDSFLKTKIQDRSMECRDADGLCIRIHLQELLLVETSGRKLCYRMADGSERICPGLIGEAAQSLSPFGFFQIQRSYIVNLKYIAEVNSREVTLLDGTRIAIGRTRSREFRKAYFQWRMNFEN